MWWKKLVLDLWSLRFDPHLCISILGLTTLVAAYFDSSKRAPVYGTVASH